MNNQDFDLGTVKHFFEHDYHDRGMMKWQGFYLSDHTAALNQQNQQLNAVYVPRPQQSLAVITEVLADAYQRDLIVTLQLNVCQLEDPHRLEITTHILGYQEDNVIGDEAQFIPLIAIRHVDYQTN
ncbi:hypothetical protein [Liquorilactobacillus uvarum]|uniref:DNA-directed RNA polymerase beta subunit n=1 Tax=Liquorilactobacillus uvarum DSM 19971 TaxID=1423812 RepID=A0A0R1PK08_9LACO|nr:hypothetical protein [Liquorilactobacillus uvarum]KRL32752.1 hypothetical protein FD20_GL002358 [Liquorilactobacillus uvarum DSM 19971]